MVLLQQLGGQLHVVVVDDVVALEYRIGLVAGPALGDRAGHLCADEVAHGRAPHVVRYGARATGRRAGAAPGPAEVSHRLAVAVEDVAAHRHAFRRGDGGSLFRSDDLSRNSADSSRFNSRGDPRSVRCPIAE